ncbi:hypothetical protein CQ12_37725 [Bradyrhizobium jicamae]|uniref:Uncharacterized protein n=1 Tax=Bradyrhizobium jicamae TaxID=280332 RepID=A0A0R3L390_9BRAD|nr:hypothetical protein CQ12_37725 [Bradyrhizobium jicamae]
MINTVAKVAATVHQSGGMPKSRIWLFVIANASAVPVGDALFFIIPVRQEDPMIDKSELKLVEAAASDDPFDLNRLRLNPEMLEAISVTKLLTTVPVRKPLPQDFVRVRPEPQYRESLAFIELKDDRETFIVDLGAVPELGGECFFATLFTATTRTGVLFMWPVKIPVDGRTSEWNVSAATAAQHAMKDWVRVKSNMSLGAYEIFEAQGSIPDPIWPELSFEEIIRIAFKDKIIRSFDHPVVKRLCGG